MELAGRDHHANEGREDDERHHPRLHQGEIVAGFRQAWFDRLRAARRS
jgi:hypothetical protein